MPQADRDAGSTAARVRAIVLAGHSGDHASARRGLSDADAEVRIAAIGALERLSALDRDELAECLRDSAAPVRRRAAEAASGLPGVSLVDALDDPDGSVVEAAAWAIGERGEATDAEFTALVDRAFRHAEPLVREAVVAALGAIGDERGLDAILAGCADKPAVRRRAVLALAPFDGPRVEAAIDAALGDRDWQVRQAAEDLRRAIAGH